MYCCAFLLVIMNFNTLFYFIIIIMVFRRKGQLVKERYQVIPLQLPAMVLLLKDPRQRHLLELRKNHRIVIS